MLEFLEKLRAEHTEDDAVIAINEIETEINQKRYGLVWEEHEEHVDAALQQGVPVFTEVPERALDAGGAQPCHFLLEGDNLHSLRLLEKTHRGRVDVIYIDPPYNRGKGDFIYDDNYVVPEDGFPHSKWLSFMEKRLESAKRLLSPRGLLFISIDDNELAQLKLLCDELLGEDRFINLFIWKRNSSGKTEKDKFTVNTEYVLLYAGGSACELRPAYKPLAGSSEKLYSRDDHDGRGRYQTVSLQKPRDPGPETTFDYVDNRGKVWKCPPKGWRMRYEKIKALENDNRLVLTGRSLRVKDYWNERDSTGKRIDTLWDDLPENSKASKDLEQLLGRAGAFENPKPVELVKRCLSIGPPDAVVLDFFAGSGTTGQAVLELNREDGGSRRFLLCTNDENGICQQVTYPRLKTVITGRRPDGSVYSDGLPANLRYYRTDFIPRFSDDPDYSVQEGLLLHLAEMVQLELGTGLQDVLLLRSDEEADRLLADASALDGCRAVFVSAAVLLTGAQERRLAERELPVYLVPDHYFAKELLEVGER